MKKAVYVLFTIFILLSLSACMCAHEWVDANCVNPRTCTKCSITEGEPLGHTLLDADCTHARLCAECGLEEGSPIGHQWINATCVDHKTCSICQELGGPPLGHNYVTIEVIREPTCLLVGLELKKCTTCGNKQEFTTLQLEHDYVTITDKCIETTICQNCNHIGNSSLVHNWYFRSINHIDSCTYSKSTFYGTITCKNCKDSMEGSIVYSPEEFENTFCKWVDTGYYDDIARYPDENTNHVMKFTGYILQDCGNNMYRMSTRGRYDDVIMVDFIGKTNGRILEGDCVTVFGKPNLLYTYTSTLGSRITIPKFTAYYIHF